MSPQRLLPARAVVLTACALLFATAAPSSAQPYRDGATAHPAVPSAAPAPVVTETIVRPTHHAPNPLVVALASAGAVLALVGAGYAGARIATRPDKLAAS